MIILYSQQKNTSIQTNKKEKYLAKFISKYNKQFYNIKYNFKNKGILLCMLIIQY